MRTALIKMPSFLCFFSLTIILVAGCHVDSLKEQQKYEKAQIKEFQEKQSELMKKYSTGTLSEARQALEDEVLLVDRCASLETNARYGILEFTYLRLYLLETRSHTNDSANMALLGMQYWASRRVGLNDLSSTSALQRIAPSNLLNDIDFINKLDKNIAGGKPPKYVQIIADAQTNMNFTGQR